jgi:hypothetical protein
MHLLEVDPQTLRLQYFKAALESLTEATEEERREFIQLYLTDTDLEAFKDHSNEELIQVVNHNLMSINGVNRLERKAMVARYMQKKYLTR